MVVRGFSQFAKLGHSNKELISVKSNHRQILLKKLSMIALYFILILNTFINVIASELTDDEEKVILRRVAPVGKIFTIEENEKIDETPIWLVRKNETLISKFYTGIPQFVHIGKHIVVSAKGKYYFLNVF